MTDIGTHEAVTSYLASLRAELADLPPSEVEEILDDVGPHVAEVASELGDEDLPQRLVERLGEPEQYAAELRAAAGYPARPREAAEPSRPRTTGLRVALWLLVAATVLGPLFAAASGGGAPGFTFGVLLSAALAGLSLAIVQRSEGGLPAFAELAEVRWLRERNPGGAMADYGRQLQPGWWLVRAGIAALLVAAALGAQPIGLWLLLLTVPLAIGSIWLGRRSRADRRWLWAVLPLNAFAVIIGLIVLSQISVGRDGPVEAVSDDGSTIGKPVPVPAFSNVFPFDANGKPLTGVYLYDQRGRPITPPVRASECSPTDRIPPPANQYPQPVYEYDRFGACVQRSAAPTPSQLPTPSVPATPTPPPAPTS